jgi:spore germination protein KA
LKTRIPIPLQKLLRDKQVEKQKDLAKAEQKVEEKQQGSQNQLKNENKSKTLRNSKVKINYKKQGQNQDVQVREKNNIGFDLKKNMNYIKETLGNSSDIVTRDFHIGLDGEIKIGVIYTDGLTNSDSVQEFILETLMVKIRNAELESEEFHALNLMEALKNDSLPVGEIKEISEFQKLFLHLLSGDSIILFDGFETGYALGFRNWADRGVQEPSSQTVVRGPKDGFSETLRTNTALIRRRIKDPNLWLETSQIGKRTQTDVSLMYLKGVVNDKIVKEVQDRLKRIDTDAILESGYIEELIQDSTYTPFPTVFNTERPDAVAGAILEGRIAILVDGTPFVLIVPALFTHFFQSSEDYYQRADIASLMRILRYICFFLALLTPSIYIAVTTFHQEMLPSSLIINLASQREGVPFPALVEAMLMELTFEILREAGVRLPRAVGSSISIVGALVIGQAAVEAGFVSASMVIVVSLTAISSFVSPTFNLSISIRILRFLFMILAATFGLFGIILGLIVMVLHLNSLRSFGIPYLSPSAPFILEDQKDNILRFPHWALSSRPRLINQKDINRGESPPPKPTR